jgi:hypothetical protein
MARKKTIKAEPVSHETQRIADRLKEAVKRASITDLNGKLIEDFDPLEMLAQFAASPHVKYDLRLRALTELSQYVAPKLKGLELAGNPEKPLNIVFTNFGDGPDEEVIGYRGGLAVTRPVKADAKG